MKDVLLSLAVLLSARASAQTDFPSCANNCYDSALIGSPGCSPTDIGCFCASSAFISSIACCLAASCDVADQQASLSYLQSECKANGLSITSPLTCSSITSSTSSMTKLISSASASFSLSISSYSGNTSTTAVNPSSTPSGATPLPATSNNGLSTSAKAGIGTAAIATVLMLLGIFFLLKRRKIATIPQNEYQLPVEAELPMKPNKHEIEERNTGYELSAKDEKRQGFDFVPDAVMEPYYAAMPELPAEKPGSPSVQRKELPTSVNYHEKVISFQPRGELQRGSPVPQQTTFSQPFESGLEVVEQFAGRENGVNSPLDGASSRLSGQTVLSDAETSGGSSRMEGLRAKREKIRAEKERLLKLQELDEMDAAVQKEMLEEQMKQSRGRDFRKYPSDPIAGCT